MLKQNRTISTNIIQNGIYVCTKIIFLTVITLFISIADSLLKVESRTNKLLTKGCYSNVYLLKRSGFC